MQRGRLKYQRMQVERILLKKRITWVSIKRECLCGGEERGGKTSGSAQRKEVRAFFTKLEGVGRWIIKSFKRSGRQSGFGQLSTSRVGLFTENSRGNNENRRRNLGACPVIVIEVCLAIMGRNSLVGEDYASRAVAVRPSRVFGKPCWQLMGIGGGCSSCSLTAREGGVYSN